LPAFAVPSHAPPHAHVLILSAAVGEGHAAAARALALVASDFASSADRPSTCQAVDRT